MGQRWHDGDEGSATTDDTGSAQAGEELPAAGEVSTSALREETASPPRSTTTAPASVTTQVEPEPEAAVPVGAASVPPPCPVGPWSQPFLCLTTWETDPDWRLTLDGASAIMESRERVVEVFGDACSLPELQQVSWLLFLGGPEEMVHLPTCVRRGWSLPSDAPKAEDCCTSPKPTTSRPPEPPLVPQPALLGPRFGLGPHSAIVTGPMSTALGRLEAAHVPLKAQVGQDLYVLDALLRRASADRVSMASTCDPLAEATPPPGAGSTNNPRAAADADADAGVPGGSPHWHCYKTNGTFVDVGAHDGVTFSNSYALEVGLGWHGVCVEPLEEVFAALTQARACTAVRAAAFNSSGTAQFQRLSGKAEMLSGIVGTYDALHTQRIMAELNRTDEVSTAAFTEVPTATLASLLSHPEVGVDHVDVLSVDTENSELAVLQGMDFGAVTVDIIVVEDAYATQSWALYDLLQSHGFVLHNVLDFDTIFVRREAWLADFGQGVRLPFPVRN